MKKTVRTGLETTMISTRIKRYWIYVALLAIACIFALSLVTSIINTMLSAPKLLTDPFLQLPSKTSVRVVWFTEFSGSQHFVTYGANLQQKAIAHTTQLSRTREDQESKLPTPYPALTSRPVWRHEAEVNGLTPDASVPYRVTSMREDGATVSSAVFSLTANPSPGKPLKILLTSDHQLKPMSAANYQKVVETVGRVDAVLFAGDLVNIADRASEWFDDAGGAAFFPVLQGRAHYDLKKQGVTTRYTGGALIQSAPLFAAIGNHEVMGRFSPEQSLDFQFNDAFPRAAAETLYQQQAASLNPTGDRAIQETWLKDNSFNTDTYEEIFSLPTSAPGGKKYYAVTFGDVRLVVLYITNMWRPPSLAPNSRGKYRERQEDLNQPSAWGYGQIIFTAIAKGSPQYKWLQQELASPEFKQAKYKVVMFHHPPHSLGENSVPAYTDPIQITERDATGQVTAIRYEYPQSADYILRDVVPLLEQAGVQLVYYGHSHLWNRFLSSSGMHFLESSNVGNSYGAYVGNRTRSVPKNYQEQYAEMGNPNGLEPIMPTLAPLQDDNGKPMPYLSSNDITAFSIFDTDTGTISSYRFDTREPASTVVKFDEFTLKE